MKRRGFLGRLAALVGAGVAAPHLLRGAETVTMTAAEADAITPITVEEWAATGLVVEQLEIIRDVVPDADGWGRYVLGGLARWQGTAWSPLPLQIGQRIRIDFTRDGRRIRGTAIISNALAARRSSVVVFARHPLGRGCRVEFVGEGRLTVTAA